MLTYVIRRIIGAICVLLLITVITFAMAYLVPSDPARMIAGVHASATTLAEIRHNLGLDKPVPVQYADYLGRLLRGDLGTSYMYDRPVASLVRDKFLTTLPLAVGAWLAELLIGIPLGIYTARRARTTSDYLISALALVGLSLPVFWLGLILLYGFAFKLPIFPLGGNTGFMSLVLPSLTIGITGAAYYLRLLKASMLEVMSNDYVRTARAKGASENRVVWRHAIPNALIPVVTYAGIDIGTLMGGLIMTEATFNWNGVGMLMNEALQQSDIPVIMGTVLLAAVLVVLFNLVVDILYVFIDPRIRYD
jgi:ABC-type dipeptide/oligopeptide/nickel transport system permease component